MSTSSQPPLGDELHEYAHVNVTQPREHWDYDSLRVQWNSPDRYEVVQKIGRGKYSDVFRGIDCELHRRIVAKVLKPVKKRKVNRELKVLQVLKGGPNIVELYDVVRDPNSKTPSLIFEYVNNSDFRALFPTLSPNDIRHYLFQILLALEYAHSHGVMHRDVKPNNVCIDHAQRKVKLIDWGLAEFYHPATSYNARVASRYFKGPELLVELPMYDYRLDMWSFGCVLAGIVTLREPFFKGRDNSDQLVRIVRVLGTEDFQAYLTKYNIRLPPSLEAAIGSHSKKPWSSFVTQANQHFCSPDTFDLMDKLLLYDHTKRLSARQALQHPYFDSVRPVEHPSAGVPAAPPSEDEEVSHAKS